MITLCKTRKDAKIKGDIFYFTGKPCKYGHISKRYTSYRRCYECSIEYSLNNKDKCAKYKSKHYETNKSKCIERSVKYYKNNPEKKRKVNAAYSRLNRGKRNANLVKYRACKLNRTPLWLSEEDKEVIKDIYKKAERISKETGIQYHVDHIIPLQGRFVSGLHVPINLQLLTALENTHKSNTYTL